MQLNTIKKEILYFNSNLIKISDEKSQNLKIKIPFFDIFDEKKKTLYATFELISDDQNELISILCSADINKSFLGNPPNVAWDFVYYSTNFINFKSKYLIFCEINEEIIAKINIFSGKIVRVYESVFQVIWEIFLSILLFRRLIKEVTNLFQNEDSNFLFLVENENKNCSKTSNNFFEKKCDKYLKIYKKYKKFSF